MRIPKQIKIGGRTIKVEMVTGDQSFPDGSLGYFFSREGIIKIDNSLSKEMQESVFIHEILEAIKFMGELEIKHQDLTILESFIHQVIKDNFM